MIHIFKLLRQLPRNYLIILMSTPLWAPQATANATALPAQNPQSAELQNAFQAKFAISPDNSKELFLETIELAKHSLSINIYEFNHLEFAQRIADKIKNGLSVKMLIEGEPLGGISAETFDALFIIQQAIEKQTQREKKQKSFIRIMNKTSENTPRRYRYNHAKYILIDENTDQAKAYIGSENFKEGAYPNTGFQGNRGWQTLVHSRPLVKELIEVFKTDSSLQYKDVEEYRAGRQNQNHLQNIAKDTPKRSLPSAALGAGIIESAELVTSPNALAGISETISLARENLALELMSLANFWRNTELTLQDNLETQTPQLNGSIINPLITQIIRKAQTNVGVRVLLNDDRVFGSPPPNSKPRGNLQTVLYLNKMAKCLNLPLEARTVNIKKLEIKYIHNKGIIMDNHTVLVSSINGTKNSFNNNREVAVRLKSKDAAQYYLNSFGQDWSLSEDNSLQQLNTEKGEQNEQLTCPNPLMPLEFNGESLFWFTKIQ